MTQRRQVAQTFIPVTSILQSELRPMGSSETEDSTW